MQLTQLFDVMCDPRATLDMVHDLLIDAGLSPPIRPTPATFMSWFHDPEYTFYRPLGLRSWDNVAVVLNLTMDRFHTPPSTSTRYHYFMGIRQFLLAARAALETDPRHARSYKIEAYLEKPWFTASTELRQLKLDHDAYNAANTRLRSSMMERVDEGVAKQRNAHIVMTIVAIDPRDILDEAYAVLTEQQLADGVTRYPMYCDMARVIALIQLMSGLRLGEVLGGCLAYGDDGLAVERSKSGSSAPVLIERVTNLPPGTHQSVGHTFLFRLIRDVRAYLDQLTATIPSMERFIQVKLHDLGLPKHQASHLFRKLHVHVALFETPVNNRFTEIAYCQRLLGQQTARATHRYLSPDSSLKPPVGNEYCIPLSTLC